MLKISTIKMLACISPAVQGGWAHSQRIIREGGVYPSESHAAAPGMLPLRFVGEVCWAHPPCTTGEMPAKIWIVEISSKHFLILVCKLQTYCKRDPN